MRCEVLQGRATPTISIHIRCGKSHVLFFGPSKLEHVTHCSARGRGGPYNAKPGLRTDPSSIDEPNSVPALQPQSLVHNETLQSGVAKEKRTASPGWTEICSPLPSSSARGALSNLWTGYIPHRPLFWGSFPCGILYLSRSPFCFRSWPLA